jgi:hypothetical protein
MLAPGRAAGRLLVLRDAPLQDAEVFAGAGALFGGDDETASAALLTGGASRKRFARSPATSPTTWCCRRRRCYTSQR